MSLVRLGRVIFPLRGYLGIPFLLTMLWFCSPDPRFAAGPGWMLLFFGLAVRCWGVAGWVPQRLPADSGERLICEDGPYVYSRNPRYLGNGMMGLGGCQIAGLGFCLLPYCLLWAAIHLPIIAYEEHGLSERWGAPYREYCARVPRFLGFPKHKLGPQVLPLRWKLAFCLERTTLAGWLALALFLHGWRNVQLGSSPLWYAGSLLAGALLWLLLDRLEKKWRRAMQASSN